MIFLSVLDKLVLHKFTIWWSATQIMNPPSRAFKLEFSDDTQFAHGCITAEHIDFAGAESYITEMAEKCSLLGTNGLLLERHISNPLSRALAYWKVTLMKDYLPENMSIAIVESDATAREHLQWGIANAGTGGLAIRVFATVREAEGWLRGGGGKSGPGGQGRRAVNDPAAAKRKPGSSRGGSKHTFQIPDQSLSNRGGTLHGGITWH